MNVAIITAIKAIGEYISLIIQRGKFTRDETNRSVRAIIATDFGGHLRKLVWLTESQTGISAGIYERTPNPHATYHADGTFHVKITSRGRTIKPLTEKKCPLRMIATQDQLLGTAAFYSKDVMIRLPRFRPDRRIDALLVLGQSVFSDINCASFNIAVVHRDHEAVFIKGAYSSYEDPSFMLVAVNLFALDYFVDHRIGVIIYKGRKSN